MGILRRRRGRRTKIACHRIDSAIARIERHRARSLPGADGLHKAELSRPILVCNSNRAIAAGSKNQARLRSEAVGVVTLRLARDFPPDPNV